jgi:hypothetical protein
MMRWTTIRRVCMVFPVSARRRSLSVPDRR